MGNAALKTRDVIAEVTTALVDKSLLVDVDKLSQSERTATVAMQGFESAENRLLAIYERARSELAAAWTEIGQIQESRGKAVEARSALAEVLPIYPTLEEWLVKQRAFAFGLSSMVTRANRNRMTRLAAQASHGASLAKKVERQTLVLVDAFKEYESRLKQLIDQTESLAKQDAYLPARPVKDPDHMPTVRKVMAQTKRARAHLAK